jgi:serine phosphatase RsbU (regulator of sigma subunit)
LIAAAYTGVFLVRATLSPLVQRLTGVRSYVSIRGWEWPLLPGVVTVFGFATLAIFVRDLIQDRRDKQRLAAELEAAHMVQQALIPSQTPDIPGFQIASVYRPFGEVGGDFFQILPLPGGGALIVIGDVSGKGLPAALTVSLLIGTLLTLAESTLSPARLLAGLNLRAISRSSTAFATCLILHAQAAADSGATLTVANAGHLSPYRNGPQLTPQEIVLENSLPLGISAESTYPEVTFQLAASEQLTLLTDGVVEARNASGELYGFERTAAISSHSAEAIADAAQQFGQDDDITVLTLSRVIAVG